MPRNPAAHHLLPGATGLRLRSLGAINLRAGTWELRGAVNAFWTLYRNDRDGAEIRSGGETIPLPGAGLLLVPPGCRFDTALHADVRHLFGYFDLPGIPRLRFRGFDRPWLAPAAAEHALLGALAARERLTLDLHDTFAVLGLLAGALAGMAPAALEPATDEQRLAPALHRIDHDFASPLANRDLAAACGMAESVFIRRFKTVTGTSPAQAVMARRVQAAAQRLLDRQEPLDAVARACGLSTRPYLARVFKAVLGLSPGAYRRAHGSGPG